jgi:Tol biopolymer transport system component
VPLILGRPGPIVVEQAGRLLVVDPEQAGSSRVLAASADNREPRWSPDTRGVLLVGGSGPGAELRLVSSAGGALRRLTSNSRPEYGAVWSPRGDRVAYTLPGSLGPDGKDDPASPAEVWLVDVATGNERKLVDGFDPAWSPDGRWIAYATNGQRDQQGAHNNTLRVISVDGQDDRPLLEMGDLPADLLPSTGLPFKPGIVRLRGPAWAPDGQRLVASADGHTSLALTFDPRGRVLGAWALAYEGGVGRARWSPDAARLAVESLPATGIDVVVVVDLISRRETRIGGPAANYQASDPTWAPDGRRLALVAASVPARRGDPRETSLRVFGTDGAELGRLLTEPDLRDPDWGRAP